MEITAQMAALEEEVKVLKGEIKSILEEIRGAVLAQDNPFDAQGGLRVFQPIERSDAADEPPAQPDEALTTPPAAVGQLDEGLPGLMSPEPAATPPGAWDGAQVMPLPAMTTDGPQAALPPDRQAGSLAALADSETAPPSASVGRAAAPPAQSIVEAAAPYPWSVSTIASLVAWVDETTTRLGSTHLHMILDLARFAGLLPQEAEEALHKVIKLASSRKDSDTVSVNDTLVALRQLEAIFQGPENDEVLRLRRRRSAGGNR